MCSIVHISLQINAQTLHKSFYVYYCRNFIINKCTNNFVQMPRFLTEHKITTDIFVTKLKLQEHNLTWEDTNKLQWGQYTLVCGLNQRQGLGR